MKVVIALATRGRPQVLKRTLDASLPNIGRHNTDLMVLLDEDDHASINVVSQISNGHLVPDIRPREDSLGAKYNRVIGRGDLYFVMVDCVPQLTKGFDNLFAKAAAMYKDGIGFICGPLANLSFPGVQAVTHRTVEVMGHIYPEDYAFWFIDHHFHELAWMTGRLAMVPIEADYVTLRQPYSIGCRDVLFWLNVFDSLWPERQALAERLIDAMDIPGWLKEAKRLSFPWIHQYSTMLHNNVRPQHRQYEQFRGDPHPPDERYRRIKARAEAKLEALKRAA